VTSPAYRLTEAADDDIEDILRTSARQFGPIQRARYALLLEKAALMVAEAPERPGSWDRHGLGEGVRSFHVEHAAGRRGAAAHILYYLRGILDDGSDGVVITRVLHERMDPALHVPEVPDT
jgi:toxin ParE1/3/4